MRRTEHHESEYHAWNPGISTELPSSLFRLETLYQSPYTSTGFEELQELTRLTGIKQERLVAFTPERLVLHELIIRITADILVEEGPEEEMLGQRFRQIAHRILTEYIAPSRQALEDCFEKLQQEVQLQVREILQQTLFQPVPSMPVQSKGFFARLRRQPARPLLSIEEQQYLTIKQFKDQGLQSSRPYDKALYKSLYVILSAMATTSGRIIRDPDLLTTLISRQMCNDYGSRLIGQMLDPIIRRAIHQEGYKTILPTEKPILISLKGASASGKSTLRPLLHEVIRQQGIESESFGTISPDIWRRLLLDYDSLGSDYKYAGRLTSNEVNIIDRKLDRYIRAKAQQDRSIPHLIVDRFRFDSFTTKQIAKVLHGTYASYVDTMHMYFIITPPEATVERGWQRGLERGRYKSVEDFLGHSVEAYSGMPKLLFKWLAYDKPVFKFSFMDNSVAKGESPLTIAWGSQQALNIIDPMALINIERYQKINIYAENEAEVYPDSEQFDVRHNCGFLRQCISRLPRVNFLTAADSEPYLVIEGKQTRILNTSQLEALRRCAELDDLFNILLNN
ncbi:zeta toxin family protein [Amphritea balenae]|uniref:Uncharacterized protein n=1 Tax=Amphritea balenae TaxID=452629 RepID=A0A3P1SX45_9GAMM|nr:zeta toxin family protein [Amphritea balenae]RRD01555.1 hypothetical protein EHS89_03085 [Amphritea balenae]GGK55944.1 hypothetical protein GCM10007941_02750 [Amphritea balenae]